MLTLLHDFLECDCPYLTANDVARFVDSFQEFLKFYLHAYLTLSMRVVEL